MKIFISGQKYFGLEVYRLCKELGHEIIGVAAPNGDILAKTAVSHGVAVVPAGHLSHTTMPEGCDIGITAHSFDYIGKKTRYKPKYGWIGYHPSLLPRHRGKSSIEWAIKMRDVITGGTVFWLNQGIDRGDIAYQEWLFIDPKLFAMDSKKAAKRLWEGELQAVGLRLISRAVQDISSGVIVRAKQDERFSTWEPGTEVKDIYRPDCLMLPPKKSSSNE
jgi:methionyl-tRNA formyltransferase